MAPLDDETAKKVIRQVEFYFSDSNLPRDNFLMKTIGESEDGLVNLSLICSFSRMRGHLSLGEVKPEDVSEDTIKAVAETLKASTFLKLSEDGTKVGRVTELAKPEEVIKQLDDRTIAASPLEYDIKLEDVESFFSQHAKVNSVRLPRHVADNRLFCGTALIEFSTAEDAANLLKQTLNYSGVELELKPKKEFDDERAKQEEEVAKTRPLQAGSNRKEKVNAEPDYPKGLIVSFTLKSISGEDSTKQNGNQKQNGDQETTDVDSKDVKMEASEDVEGVKKEVSDVEGVKEEVSEDVKVKTEDVKVKTEGVTNGADSEAKQPEEDTEKSAERPNAAACRNNKDIVLREDLKVVVQKFGTVKFIDFSMGAESGYIRFEDAEAAQKARAAAVLADKGGLIVKNFIAVLDPLTGDAEKEYWTALRSGQDKHRDFKGNRGGRGGRHNNRGGRSGGWKNSRGRGNNDHQGRAQKMQKVEAA